MLVARVMSEYAFFDRVYDELVADCTQTDMTGGRGVKTPDQGAQTPVTLALADLNGMTGLFWKDDKIIDP